MIIKREELNREEREALQDTLALSLEEQLHYLDNGDPHIDYGNEWPFSAEVKATQAEITSRACAKLGFNSLREEFARLANALRASGKEYQAIHATED